MFNTIISAKALNNIINNENLIILDLDSREEWIYDHNDELNNIEVFDIINDGDWVCLLTDNGLIFYNWSNYHY